MNALKCLVSLGLCVSMTACGGGESPDAALQAASEDCTAAPAVYRHAIDDRPVATRTMPGHGVVVATGVIARDGCSSIDGPLAAVNWWTTNNKPLLEEKYDSVVGPLALRHARIIFAGDSREVIRAAEAPLLDHETLAVVLYHSAESFSEMIGTQTHMSVVQFKEQAVADAYSFGLQRCVVGCDDLNLLPFPPNVTGPALAVHYSLPGADAADVDRAFGVVRDALAADGRSTLAFAGRHIGTSFHEFEDGARTRPFETEGVDGTLVFELKDLGDARQILQIPEVTEFLDNTAADLAVTFDEFEF